MCISVLIITYACMYTYISTYIYACKLIDTCVISIGTFYEGLLTLAIILGWIKQWNKNILLSHLMVQNVNCLEPFEKV